MKEREFVDKCLSKKLHGVPDTKSSLSNMVDDITYMLTEPGLINITRKNIKQVADASKNLVGLSAESKGKHRAKMVGEKLVSLLPSTFRKNKPTSALFNVIGDSDLALYEVNDIANYVYDMVDPKANIIFGATINDNKKGYIKTTVVFGCN